MVKIQAQTIVTKFIIRLIVCFVIFGGIYLAFFHQKAKSHNIPQTPVQKVANIRSLLDQTYVASNQISTFNSGTLSGSYALANIFSQFGGNVISLQTAISSAPSLLPKNLKSDINQILSQELSAKSSYLSISNILGNIINYDPSTDLSLSLPQNNAELQTRVQAAIGGMNQAANSSEALSSNDDLSVQSDNGDLAVSSQTKTNLLQQVDCFQSILSNLKQNNSAASQTDINNCSNSYTKTRSIAIQNSINDSFNPSFISYLKSAVLPVLQKLDSIINSSDKNAHYQ